MRAEPHIIGPATKSLIKNNLIREYNFNNSTDGTKFYVPNNFGSAGDISRAKAFNEWRNLHNQTAQKNEYCGYILEKIIYDSALKTNKYNVFGSGPKYNDKNKLYKSSGSELLTFDGNDIYKIEKGAGFDLFIIHKNTNIAIGIEAKNIREWIYPASVEVWRAIARACTLNCLPVLIARKISYIAKAGFFAHIGMLGYDSNFQFFDNSVQKDNNYKFKKNVINKDRLGFADIKLIKPNDPTPEYMINFFDKILDENIEEYYKKFIIHKNILKKYSIDYGMAEDNISKHKRFILYSKFKEEIGYDDIELPL